MKRVPELGRFSHRLSAEICPNGGVLAELFGLQWLFHAGIHATHILHPLQGTQVLLRVQSSQEQKTLSSLCENREQEEIKDLRG